MGAWRAPSELEVEASGAANRDFPSGGEPTFRECARLGSDNQVASASTTAVRLVATSGHDDWGPDGTNRNVQVAELDVYNW